MRRALFEPWPRPRVREHALPFARVPAVLEPLQLVGSALLTVVVMGVTACAGQARSVSPPSAPVAAGVASPHASDAPEPPAAAEAAPLSVRYHAPEACPGEGEFVEALLARAPELRSRLELREGAARGELTVDIGAAAPREWSGRLSLEAKVERLERSVAGATCAEVVDALALIASFWIRPPAGSGELAAEAGSAPLAVHHGPAAAARGAGTAGAARVPSAARADSVATSRGVTGLAAPGEAAAISSVSPRLPTEPARDRSAADEVELDEPGGSDETQPSTARSLHAIAHLGYATSPAGLLRAGLRFELWASEAPSSWALGATAAYAAGQLRQTRLGASELALLSAQLDLCAPAVAARAAAWLRGCAHGRLGRLRFAASAENLESAGPRYRPWAAAGLGLHLGIPVSSNITLRALTELSANLVRDEFALERVAESDGVPIEVTPVYAPGWVTLDIGAGVGYEF